MTPATLVLILESMVPLLVFIRAQAPSVASREAVIAAFEALA